MLQEVEKGSDEWFKSLGYTRQDYDRFSTENAKTFLKLLHDLFIIKIGGRELIIKAAEECAAGDDKKFAFYMMYFTDKVWEFKTKDDPFLNIAMAAAISDTQYGSGALFDEAMRRFKKDKGIK